MIDVTNVNVVNKGSLFATCDVYIQPWDFELYDVKIFQKGNSRWLGMPSKKTANEQNEEKWSPICGFRRESTKTRFRTQVMSAIEKYLETHSATEPEPLIKEGEDLPF